MFFAPLTFPDAPTLPIHEVARRLLVPRADQAPVNFSSDISDNSEYLSSLTISDTALTDLDDLESSDVRTIDGSSRLYSKANAHYLLPLGMLTIFPFHILLLTFPLCLAFFAVSDQEEFQRLYVSTDDCRVFFLDVFLP